MRRPNQSTHEKERRAVFNEIPRLPRGTKILEDLKATARGIEIDNLRNEIAQIFLWRKIKRMTAFTHIDTLRSKPVDEFRRPVTRRERHIPRHFNLTCTACGRAARTAHCPPKSLARYMNEEHEGLIPFERYQGDLKQEFMLMEVGSQKPTEFVSGLHYLIERSEGDCVKPVTRQQGAGHDGGHSRRNQCD